MSGMYRTHIFLDTGADGAEVVGLWDSLSSDEVETAKVAMTAILQDGANDFVHLETLKGWTAVRRSAIARVLLEQQQS